MKFPRISIPWSRLSAFIPFFINLIFKVEKEAPELKGPGKEQALINLAEAFENTVEALAGKDLLSNPALRALMSAAIAAIVALQNGIEAFKHVKNTQSLEAAIAAPISPTSGQLLDLANPLPDSAPDPAAGAEPPPDTIPADQLPPEPSQ